MSPKLTPGGKDIPNPRSLNAVSHSLSADTPVIPGVEFESDWTASREAWLRDLQPVGYVEKMLAERIALLHWRSLRVHRYERDAAAASAAAALQHLNTTQERLTLPGLQVDRQHAEGMYGARRVLLTFPGLHDSALMPYSDVLAALHAAAGDDTSIVSRLAFPDRDPDSGEIICTAADLRRLLGDVAASRGVNPDSMIAGALVELSAGIIRTNAIIDRVDADLDNRRLKAEFPDDTTLNNVVRYEAHLDRLFYRAYHELEVRQSRRLGRPVNLTRVQIHGLPGA
jgi:hypothetical protein